MTFFLLCLFYLGTALSSALSIVEASTSFEESSRDRSSRDEVQALPGFDGGSFNSKHHGGFLTVDLQRQSHLYYYFVESENDPASDPLVLWLNGGPGCSSFDGFVYELGPFHYDYNNGDVKLSKNPYAWTKVANVIFLDSPAGVGLSYSEGIEHYATDDVKTAEDLHAAVLKFMELFPEFTSNRFFVAGESYAGIYIPMLVNEIVKGNEAKMTPSIHLIGYLIGNGVTDPKIDANAFTPFAHGKSLISDDVFSKITKACDGVYWNTTIGSDCLKLQNEAFAEMFALPLNRYNVAGKCDIPPEGIMNDDTTTTRFERINAFVKENGWIWPFGPVPAQGLVYNWRNAVNNEPPCTDYWTVETWLNRDDVRQAIHAAPVDISGFFYLCSNRMAYKRTVRSVLDLHKKFVTRDGLYALIYSGDHDFAVPHTGTEMWTATLGLERLSPWKAWIDPEGQVGGYHVEYRGLTYCTIRNAGHMVPETNPPQALEMFRRYLTQLTMNDPTKERSLTDSRSVY